VSDAGSRDYEDVEEAARQLGADTPGQAGDGQAGDGQAPDGRIRPIEESDEVAAAVDDEAPVPDLE
jgi:hypothetical protein